MVEKSMKCRRSLCVTPTCMHQTQVLTSQFTNLCAFSVSEVFGTRRSRQVQGILLLLLLRNQCMGLKHSCVCAFVCHFFFGEARGNGKVAHGKQCGQEQATAGQQNRSQYIGEPVRCFYWDRFHMSWAPPPSGVIPIRAHSETG